MTNNNDSAPFGDIQFLRDGIYIRCRGRKHRIGDPILVTAFATNEEDAQREQAFVVIKFKNRRGKWRKDIIPSSVLTGNDRDFVARLSALGYLWPSDRKSGQRSLRRSRWRSQTTIFASSMCQAGMVTHMCLMRSLYAIGTEPERFPFKPKSDC